MQYEDLDLLESFHLDIQDGHHGSHFEILQMTSPEPYAGLNLYLVGVKMAT